MGFARPAAVALACCLIASGAAGSQGSAPPGAPAAAFPKPARPVAEIISPIWATETERDAVDEVGQVARAMGLGAGQTVADIGAGSGYYVTRLSKIVGPTGVIFGQDVLPKYLAGLAARVKREKLGNVVLVQGQGHDPRLRANSLDAAVLIHMYHEIAQPFAFMYNLVPALKPGARVGIVDLDRATWEHGTPRDLLACELAAVGYRQVEVRELSGGVGYLAVFEPPSVAARPEPAAVKACPLPGRR